MINFKESEMEKQVKDLIHGMANDIMRPIARYYDEHEHQKPTELEPFRVIMQSGGVGSAEKRRVVKRRKLNKPMTKLAAM